MTDRFVRDNGIDRNNPMTGDQACKLLDNIDSSKDPRIRKFTTSLEDYMKDGEKSGRGRRLRGGWGGGRGRE